VAIVMDLQSDGPGDGRERRLPGATLRPDPPPGGFLMATTTRSRTSADRGSSRTSSSSNGSSRTSRASSNGTRRSPQPRLGQTGGELQRFGTLRQLPIALAADARAESCRILSEIQSDTMILAALYKKAHWNAVGPTFYQLHLLFDKHYEEQAELVDALAERIQMLGGISVGDPRHAAELTTIPRPPDGAEEVPVTIDRLLQAHEIILEKVREGIDKTEQNDDWGSNDLLMSDVLRTNEMEVWFVSEHVVDVPLVEA
jgi:starvation-inducible DNA-binding protein